MNLDHLKKRKSEVDLIFEINEEDCSPPSSPEHEQESKTNEDLQNSNEICSFASAEDSELEKNEVKTVLNNSDTNKVIILSEENDTLPSITVNNEKQTVVPTVEENEGDKFILSADKFLFSIKFRDRNFADLNKDKIIKAIMSALDCNIREEFDELGLKVKFWEGKSASDMEITDDSDEGLCVNDTADIDNLFVVDTTPSSNRNLNGQPKFYSRTKYTIEDEKNQSTEENNKTRSTCNQSICFNCEGPHALKDCKEPKNYRKINMARNKHKEMKSAKNTRYHLEEEQKYGHLTPGKLSEKLREALGLREDELPAHVYHMRRLGYPMGWLEVARRTSSDMALYDFHGREDGRRDFPSQIDPDKVVEYEGFNMPCAAGVRDAHARHGCPAYSKQHSKDAMLAHLATTRMANSTHGAPCVGERDAAARCDSPSLGELERQKQQLLDMLNNGVNVTPQERVSLEQLATDTPPSLVRSSAYGTPVLKGCSPYERLPRPENFSAGVSQVINFENLPDSTGKYEQMTGVLGKVRKTIKFTVDDKS